MSSPPPLTPLAAAVLHVGRPERVLQVACGDGDAALFLAREFPAARVRGIDADADLVGAARARIGLDPEGRVAFKVGGPRRIPYPDDHFDLVAALDARPAPAELARVLRPGGHLILAATRGAATGERPLGLAPGPGAAAPPPRDDRRRGRGRRKLRRRPPRGLVWIGWTRSSSSSTLPPAAAARRWSCRGPRRRSTPAGSPSASCAPAASTTGSPKRWWRSRRARSRW